MELLATIVFNQQDTIDYLNRLIYEIAKHWKEKIEPC